MASAIHVRALSVSGRQLQQDSEPTGDAPFAVRVAQDRGAGQGSDGGPRGHITGSALFRHAPFLARLQEQMLRTGSACPGATSRLGGSRGTTIVNAVPKPLSRAGSAGAHGGAVAAQSAQDLALRQAMSRVIAEDAALKARLGISRTSTSLTASPTQDTAELVDGTTTAAAVVPPPPPLNAPMVADPSADILAETDELLAAHAEERQQRALRSLLAQREIVWAARSETRMKGEMRSWDAQRLVPHDGRLNHHHLAAMRKMEQKHHKDKTFLYNLEKLRRMALGYVMPPLVTNGSRSVLEQVGALQLAACSLLRKRDDKKDKAVDTILEHLANLLVAVRSYEERPSPADPAGLEDALAACRAALDKFASGRKAVRSSYSMKTRSCRVHAANRLQYVVRSELQSWVCKARGDFDNASALERVAQTGIASQVGDAPAVMASVDVVAAGVAAVHAAGVEMVSSPEADGDLGTLVCHTAQVATLEPDHPLQQLQVGWVGKPPQTICAHDVAAHGAPDPLTRTSTSAPTLSAGLAAFANLDVAAGPHSLGT